MQGELFTHQIFTMPQCSTALGKCFIRLAPVEDTTLRIQIGVADP